MSHFLTLLLHELKSLSRSLSTYIAGGVFLLLMGTLYLLILGEFSRRAQTGTPTEQFFELFWVPFFLLIPMLTMRSISEERRRGTLETMMTTPVSAVEIVVTKFLAAYLLYCLLWSLTALFPVIAGWRLDSPYLMERLIDTGSMLGGYSYVAISGMLAISLGIFCSSLTRTQLVAGMLCLCMLFILIVGLAVLRYQADAWPGWLDGTVEYFDLIKHRNDYLKGVIDTRPLLFYVSSCFLFLGLSVIVVESKA